MAQEDVAMRIAGGDQQPDHSTICDFRQRHLKVFIKLFREVLQLCEEAGLVKLGHVALDGTKIKANASQHKAMSYERMVKREKELEEQVQALMSKAQETDEAEDHGYGKGRRGDELPEEMKFKKQRLEKIREAERALEEAAAQKQREREALERKAAEEGRTVGGHPPKIDPTPDPKAQRNFTDPESRIMKGRDGFVQAYHAQAGVDAQSQVIVAYEVTDSAVDAQPAKPMMRAVQENLGRSPEKASMDAGYYSQDNVEALMEAGTDPYIATGRQKHGEPSLGPPRGRIPQGATAKERMRRKLMTRRGRPVYSRRKVIVEPVFGQVKNRGFRQFSFRGLQKVRGEWARVCLTHNVLKLYRAGFKAGRN